MRYVVSRYQEMQRDAAYRIYVTDSLYYNARNEIINVRYCDLISGKKQDQRTGDEIAADVIKSAGLVVE